MASTTDKTMAAIGCIYLCWIALVVSVIGLGVAALYKYVFGG